MPPCASPPSSGRPSTRPTCCAAGPRPGCAGDPAGAAADFARVVDLAGDCGAPELTAAARLGLARLALDRGALAEARRLALTALDECPAGWYTADGVRMTILVTLGRAAAAAGDRDEARRRYRQVSTVGSGPDAARILAAAEAGLAELAAR